MSSEKLQKRKKVLSGIQPTGHLHLGRYFGAIRNWVELQEKYDCLYGIVDYHALTMPFDPKRLREQVWDLAFDLMAVGLNPDYMFIQSMVPEHTELAWIFNCLSSYGEVSRMTQFKDKSQQIGEKDKDAFISTGLFTYPVLQAADILIYKADYVPVGKDQDQHLELSRNIAQRFNSIVGHEYFVLPETLYTSTPKVMSTADPSKKMSASLGPKHYINVFSEPDIIRKQIKSAVTDVGNINVREWIEDYSDNVSEPNFIQFIKLNMGSGVRNLLEILEASGGEVKAKELLIEIYKGNPIYGKLKETVADYIINLTNSFREKRSDIIKNKSQYIEQVIVSSASIRQQAQQTIFEVKDLLGLMNIKRS